MINLQLSERCSPSSLILTLKASIEGCAQKMVIICVYSYLPDNRPTTSLRHAEAVERLLLHSKAWQHSSTKQSLFLRCKVDTQTCQCLETLIDVWWCHFNNDVKKFQSNTIENYFSLLRWDFCKLPFVVRRKNIIESHYLKLQNKTIRFAITT